MIEFKATLHQAKVDKEGEWQVVFTCPSNEGVKIASLSLLTETVFDVRVKPEEKDRNSDI